MMSLRAQENVEGFIQALQQDYYETYERIPEEYFDIPKSIPEAGKHRKPKAGWTNIVFASRPSSGGAILKLSPQGCCPSAVMRAGIAMYRIFICI